jgi:hypothetical protein
MLVKLQRKDSYIHRQVHRIMQALKFGKINLTITKVIFGLSVV